MKDLSHHRGYLQKKVIQGTKSSVVNAQVEKPLKFRYDHEIPCWEPKDEVAIQEKAAKEALRDSIRLKRVAKPRKERKVLQY